MRDCAIWRRGSEGNGIKVEIQTLNMAKMVDELKGGTPPADIVFCLTP